MTVFTSARERGLWSCALALLLAIFAAAALAGSLVDAVGATVLLGIAFGAGLLLALIAGVGIALGHPSSAKLWVAFALGSAYLMIGARAGVPALERTHLFEYGLLAIVLYEAMAERTANGAGPRHPGLVSVTVAALVGWADEAVQSLVPPRVYDVRDVGINVLAAVIAVTAVATLRWGRRAWQARGGHASVP